MFVYDSFPSLFLPKNAAHVQGTIQIKILKADGMALFFYSTICTKVKGNRACVGTYHK